MKRVAASGFTLIGVMLLLVVASIAIVLSVNYSQQRAEKIVVEKVVQDIQQIANAGLAYYVKNGRWPGAEYTIYTLDPANPASGTSAPSPLQISSIFLPNNGMYAPGGVAYQHEWDSLSTFPGTTTPTYAGYFWIYAKIGGSTTPTAMQSAIQKRLTGVFPLSKMYDNGNVWVAIPPPGQNLSNATALNFAGLYHHGACIPVPACPSDANGSLMTAQVYITPVSVSGVNDTGSTNVYPISSFTAFASGTASATPANCDGTTPATACPGTPTNTALSPDTTPASGIVSSNTALYWRACVQIVTERGDVAATNTGTGTQAWGQYVTVAAFTRCALSTEATGSNFTVYSH